MASRIAFSLVFLLAACASLDREECVNADWYAIGLEDGARGVPNTDRYLAGRIEGLKTFCTYERGYSEGRAGRAYGAGCPQASKFVAGYQRGRDNKELARTRSALKEGIPNPRARASELERLESLTREAAELEARIRSADN